MLRYRLLIVLLSPIIIGHIIGKAAGNKQLRYFWQRLGFNYSTLPKNCLWFHCASVGEVNTALPLLKHLHTKNSQLKFIITSNTITGGEIVAQQNLPYLFHCYLPFDWRFSVQRFLNTAQPTTLYIMETEIWPNLFHLCHRQKISIHIINARLSSQTIDANRWLKSVLKTALSHVTTIAARSAKNAAAYASLGAATNIITVTGNLKLSTAINPQHTTASNNFSHKRGYVLVASTHDDEEQQIYTIWKKLKRKELLIIAPRHPERGANIIKKLQCKKISIRSKQQAVNDGTQVFLLDTVGELKNYFYNAKIVIMGGSFVAIGGHNILEPAACNAAIITGPHMENFKDELELMSDKNAIIQVDSYVALEKKLLQLLENKDQRETLKDNCRGLTHNAEAVLENYSALILKSSQN